MAFAHVDSGPTARAFTAANMRARHPPTARVSLSQGPRQRYAASQQLDRGGGGGGGGDGGGGDSKQARSASRVAVTRRHHLLLLLRGSKGAAAGTPPIKLEGTHISA